MLFIIAFILAGAFSILLGSQLKKHSYGFYVGAVLLSILAVILDFRTWPAIVNNYVASLFTRGAFATALWCVVMWMGALKNGSYLMKKLMPIRGELSIVAAILTLGHNIGYGKIYFVMLFTSPEKLGGPQRMAILTTIILMLIMIPLTIMSFPQIRKKMKARTWKRWQRMAYVFYGLIYLHILFLYVPMVKLGRDGYGLSLIVYSAVFIGYGVCRVRKALLKKEIMPLKQMNIASIAIFSVVVAIILGTSFTSKKVEVSSGVTNQKDSNSQIMADVDEDDSSEEMITEETTLDEETTTLSELDTVENIMVAKTSGSVTTTSDDENVVESSEVQEGVSENVSEEQEEGIEQAQEVNQVTDVVIQTTQAQTEAPTTQMPSTTVSLKYKEGNFNGTAFGYDGDIHVTITIKNDLITAIQGSTEESDEWYYDEAQAKVIPAIISKQSTSVDAVSGATYSSKAIMSAVEKALNSAKK